MCAAGSSKSAPTALQVVEADGLFLCIHSHSGRQTSPTAEGKKPDGDFNL